MRLPVLAATLACTLVALPGCSIFRGDATAYELPPGQRPLEIPPELEVAGADPAAEGTQSALRSETGAQRQPGTQAPSGTGFTVAGTRDEVFARLGTALEAVEGVEIATRAQLLGAYDVGYQGANFLVRVTPVEAGTYVSAVDPRGLPVQGEGAVALMATLQAALGGR